MGYFRKLQQSLIDAVFLLLSCHIQPMCLVSIKLKFSPPEPWRQNIVGSLGCCALRGVHSHPRKQQHNVTGLLDDPASHEFVLHLYPPPDCHLLLGCVIKALSHHLGQLHLSSFSTHLVGLCGSHHHSYGHLPLSPSDPDSRQASRSPITPALPNQPRLGPHRCELCSSHLSARHLPLGHIGGEGKC